MSLHLSDSPSDSPVLILKWSLNAAVNAEGSSINGWIPGRIYAKAVKAPHPRSITNLPPNQNYFMAQLTPTIRITGGETVKETYIYRQN